jgi:hypothetical protein
MSKVSQTDKAVQNRQTGYSLLRGIGGLIGGPIKYAFDGTADLLEQGIETDDTLAKQGKKHWRDFSSQEGLSKLLTGNENTINSAGEGDYIGALTTAMSGYSQYKNISGNKQDETINNGGVISPDLDFGETVQAKDGIVIGNDEPPYKTQPITQETNFTNTLLSNNLNPNYTALGQQKIIGSETSPDNTISKPQRMYSIPPPKQIKDDLYSEQLPTVTVNKNEVDANNAYSTWREDYDKNLKTSKTMANIKAGVETAALLYGLYNSFNRKPSEKVKFRPTEAPQLTDPSLALRAETNAQMDKSTAMLLRNIKSAGGMPDLYAGIGAAHYNASKDLGIQGAKASNEVKNKQAELDYNNQMANNATATQIEAQNIGLQTAENDKISAERATLLAGISNSFTTLANLKTQATQKGIDMKMFDEVTKDMDSNQKVLLLMQILSPNNSIALNTQTEETN